MKPYFLYFILIGLIFPSQLSASDSTKHSSLKHIKTITGKISPKSIVHNGHGLFFAQNMMYKHTITVYDRDYQLVKSIKDKIRLSKYNTDTLFKSENYHRGAPVECVFTHEGKYAWVSNYEMTGDGFENPGCDNCRDKDEYDPSFVYKINTKTFEIESVIKVGSVPKYLASTKNNKLVLVSNWTSGDLSIIDTDSNTEIKRISIGRFPRGIVIDNKRNLAYVAVMGSDKIAKINLSNFSKSYFEIGEHPRHLCLDENENILYATLNGEGKVAKVNLTTQNIQKLRTGLLPRSMDYCDYNKNLYIVNYGSNYLSKVDAISFTIKDTITTKSKPIGVTIDKEKGEIWVACYSGSLMIYKDSDFKIEPKMGPFTMDLALLEPMIKKTQPTAPKETTIKSKTKESKTPLTKAYHIIVGSFKQKNNAIRLSETLQKEYKNCHYFRYSNGNYYVTINSFDSKSSALIFLNKERKKSSEFKGWVLRIRLI